MAEEAKQYVHPNREKARAQLQQMIDFINIRNASGWNMPDDLFFITTMVAKGLVQTTNQLISDVERLQCQIDDLKMMQAGALVTVHVERPPEPGQERKNDGQ